VNSSYHGTEIQPLVTTTGRVSGEARSAQVRVYCWRGRLIATSPFPRTRRDWVSNILANPRVTLASGDAEVSATARLVPADQDREMKTHVAMMRISWRNGDCPVFEPEEDAFVEFFTDSDPEPLFAAAAVTHALRRDPLAGDSLDAVRDWQRRGLVYRKADDGRADRSLRGDSVS